MNSFDFKGGCSIHIEYTPKDLGELKQVCDILKQYQGSFQVNGGNGKENGNGDGKWNGRDAQANLNIGNGNGKRAILSKDELDNLFDLAREKNVFLKKLVRDMFGKEINQLYGGEAQEIKRELETY